jgi:hypothetical protein
MRRRSLLRRSGTATLACALVSAAQAGAAPPTYTSNSTGLAAGTSDDVAASCPDGTKVVGGGAFTSGPSVEDEIKFSAPADSQSDADRRPDDFWYVEGNASFSADRTLTAYAMCATGKIKYIGASKRVPKFRQRSVKAKCTDGRHVIGGGVKAPHNDDTSILLVGSYPGPFFPPKSWSGTVNNGSNREIKIRTWAICGRMPTTPLYSEQGPSTATLQPGAQSSIETTGPGCAQAGDSGVTGLGGQVAGRPLDTEIASLIPINQDGDGITDDGAKAWFNNHTLSAQPMQVYAICTDF